MVKQSLKYISYALIAFITVALLWLVLSIKDSTNELKESMIKNIESNIITHSKQINIQIIDLLKRSNKSLVKTLKDNSYLQNEFNQKLELLRNTYIPYIYILWLDKDRKFRFLCDGSEEKSRFFQKFDPGNIELWKDIYQSGKFSILNQEKYVGLWKSLLYPIVVSGKIEAMLVVDYSIELPNRVNTIIKPLKKLLDIILVAFFLLFFIIILQIFYLFMVRKKSFTDPLTGIYNREFMNTISKKLPLDKYDLLIIDIDHFKKINDTYGHLIGDKVLKFITNNIKKFITKKDILIRFGGEEFVLFLYNPDKKRDAVVEAEKIRLNLSITPLKDKNYGNIYIKTSIGVFDNIDKDISFEAALREADKALYNAKKAGRNCVVKADDKSDNKTKEKYTFSQISDFVEKEQVFCQYQPIYANNTSRQIVKYEALARLRDDKGRVIMPNDFLPIIWKTNVYHRFTQQIIKESIKTFKNRKEGFTINLSLQDLLDEKILNVIDEMAKKEPETVSRMGIEILEYDRFDNIERLQNIISRLKRYNISIILDDFGSGHANFAIVERLDIDELKIDGSIVENINTNKRSKILLETLADFAKKSSIKTTVEFVSSKEIYDSILVISFSNLQGYYLGKPKELKAA